MKVGDLVYVWKPHKCGCYQIMGHVFIITQFVTNHGNCFWCKTSVPTELLAFGHPSGMACAVWRLKVIPPKDELDKLIKDEELSKKELLWS